MTIHSPSSRNIHAEWKIGELHQYCKMVALGNAGALDRCLGHWSSSHPHWCDQLNNHHEMTLLHKSMASTLWYLIFVRIIWRITHPSPDLPQVMSPLMKRTAFVGHLLLYGIALLGLPFSGW